MQLKSKSKVRPPNIIWLPVIILSLTVYLMLNLKNTNKSVYLWNKGFSYKTDEIDKNERVLQVFATPEASIVYVFSKHKMGYIKTQYLNSVFSAESE